jgi:hypothetical protein
MGTFKEEFRKYFSELLSDLELCNYDIVDKLEKDIKTLIKERKEKDNNEEDVETFGSIFFFFTGEIKDMLLDRLLEIFKQEIKEYDDLYDLFFDINIDYEDIFNVEDTKLLREQIIDKIHEHEHFIYYRDAIEYLSEEDCTLQDSLYLAYEYGLDTKDLNSCVLANILYNDNLLKIYDEAEDFLSDLLHFKEEIVERIMDILISSIDILIG